MKTPRQDLPKQNERKDRLKAALKVNMAKRKAQARARAAQDGPDDSAGGDVVNEQKE